MGEIFKHVPEAVQAFSATHHAAGATHCSAGSADAEGMLAAAAAALGPIGAPYLAAYAPAQANCLAATMLVGQLHHAIGAAAEVCTATHVALDNV